MDLVATAMLVFSLAMCSQDLYRDIRISRAVPEEQTDKRKMKLTSENLIDSRDGILIQDQKKGFVTQRTQ